ncbi:MAG: D-tyrosyl-tRNA(Tyr) deacylase [Actinomycetaceae bacterium]|nr:D-tyrosyl-tRNA(Tyr) deacylase [Actinomycetaceae bacterium]
MRALLQRVREASVDVENARVAHINEGLCAFIGITHDDTRENVEKMAKKIATMRVLRSLDGNDEKRMSSIAKKTPLLLVSQFTLYGSTKKGTRPSWNLAAPGKIAEPLFNELVACLHEKYELEVHTGVFGAMMDVHITNDGPFTLLIET